MKLTKEKCEEVVGKLHGYLRSDDIIMLKVLIRRYFDNPPLYFDELKEGMWVWDNETKWYRKIVEKPTRHKGKYILFYDSNALVKFEENRFYRREV